jgi:histidinol-phosphatase
MPPTPEMTAALRAADAADAVTLGAYRSDDLRIDTKGDASPVTEADRAAERAIRDVLGDAFPGDAILGEEYGEHGGADRRWIIDPIDATVNYIRGVPVWGSLIALEEHGVVTCGVVSAPALRRRWWAQRGSGAWAGEQRMTVSAVGELAEAQLSLNTPDGLDGSQIERALTLSRRCSRTRGFGDFWAFMLLAEGAVDIVVEPVAAVWDLAPLEVIVHEAGGRFTDRSGTTSIASGHAIATNGLLHDEVLTILGE